MTKKDTLAEKLGTLRSIKGMTQTSIAEKLGVDQSEISRVEKRGNFRVATLRKYVEEGLGGKLQIFAFVSDEAGETHKVRIL